MKDRDVSFAFFDGILAILIIEAGSSSPSAAGGVLLGVLFGVITIMLYYHWVYEDEKAKT